MTVQEREELIRAIFEDELMPLARAKGHDYSGQGDSLSNLKDFGVLGVCVRIGDKYHRLKNFLLSGGTLKVKDETIEDTIKDLIIYGFLALILKRQCSIK